MRRGLALVVGWLVLAGPQAPSAEEIHSRHCLACCPGAGTDGNGYPRDRPEYQPGDQICR